MKPAELKPLIGRKVSCYWNGYRIGEVIRVPKSDVLSVRFLPPHGTRQVPLDQVQHVYWYGKRRTVTEYLEIRSKS